MALLVTITLLLEVLVLFFLEQETWKTVYTPLNFLMLPYVAVLLVTVCISGHFDFVDFYYPSIVFWIIGLPVFAVPSLLTGYLLTSKGSRIKGTVSDAPLPSVITYIALFLCLLFLYRFYSLSGSSRDILGSEEFSMEFCGRGLWAHLRQLTIPIVVMMIYDIDRRKLWMLPVIIVLLLVNLMYQVKGWVIIPVLAGLAMRLYSGRSKFRFSLILNILLGAFLVFIIMYLVMPVLAGGTAGPEIIGFIFRHFLHYMTSGILGLSIDMQKGFPDAGSIEAVLSPIINIVKVLTGDDELVIPLNPYYWNTGINLTNVRTFFGTLFLYTSWIEYILYTLSLSTLMYLMKAVTLKYDNIFFHAIYFFECSLLMMGWFEFYFFHLTVIEFPLITLLFMALIWLSRRRTVVKAWV